MPNGAKVVKRMMQAFLGFCGAAPSAGPTFFLSRRASCGEFTHLMKAHFSGSLPF
jgi:hypothetical protein